MIGADESGCEDAHACVCMVEHLDVYQGMLMLLLSPRAQASVG